MSNTNAPSENASASATRFFVFKFRTREYEALIRATSTPDSYRFEFRVALGFPFLPLRYTLFFATSKFHESSLRRQHDIIKISGGEGNWVLRVRITKINNEDEASTWPFVGDHDIIEYSCLEPSDSDRNLLLPARGIEVNGANIPEDVLNSPSAYQRIVASEAPAIGQQDLGPNLGELASLRLAIEAGIDISAAAAQQPSSPSQAPRRRPTTPSARTQATTPRITQVTPEQFSRWMENSEASARHRQGVDDARSRPDEQPTSHTRARTMLDPPATGGSHRRRADEQETPHFRERTMLDPPRRHRRHRSHRDRPLPTPAFRQASQVSFDPDVAEELSRWRWNWPRRPSHSSSNISPQNTTNSRPLTARARTRPGEAPPARARTVLDTSHFGPRAATETGSSRTYDDKDLTPLERMGDWWRWTPL